MLSHHQMDTQTAGQNAIPDPASVAGLAAAVLEFASDTDSEEESQTFPLDSLPRREADSELDSADSDVDPLEHAEVFTTEEITRIYLEKLQKLKSMYVGEYKRLIHILRESRRKYLQAVRVEKETMVSIHDQPKPTPEEREAYEEVKALARYHKHLSTHSLLHRQQLERRMQVTEGVNHKPGMSIGCVKCVYSEGSWKCGEKSVPLSKYCNKHILHDPNQVLFGACGVGKCEEDQCSIPVINLPYANTCIYHTPVPDPIPVTSSLVEEEAETSQGGGFEEEEDEEDFYRRGGYPGFTPTGPPNIIDLPESHSFIVTELPPENVMEEDGTPMDTTEGGEGATETTTETKERLNETTDKQESDTTTTTERQGNETTETTADTQQAETTYRPETETKNPSHIKDYDGINKEESTSPKDGCTSSGGTRQDTSNVNSTSHTQGSTSSGLELDASSSRVASNNETTSDEISVNSNQETSMEIDERTSRVKEEMDDLQRESTTTTTTTTTATTTTTTTETQEPHTNTEESTQTHKTQNTDKVEMETDSKA